MDGAEATAAAAASAPPPPAPPPQEPPHPDAGASAGGVLPDPSTVVAAAVESATATANAQGNANSSVAQQPPPQPQPLAAALPRLADGPELPFVAPFSYLRPKQNSSTMATDRSTIAAPNPLELEQLQGLRGIREFLKVRTSYDVLPLSFRLIILDNDLLIKKSLNIFINNGIVSAPLWDSEKSKFAGLLTSTDYINVIQYYVQFPDQLHQVDQFRLSSLRDIEKAIGVVPLETLSVHPMRPLYEACRRMLQTRARRIPLVDVDDETGREMVLSVITQYRILKFIAVNNEQYTVMLKKSVRECGLGTYTNLATATMETTVLEAIDLMVKYNISAVPVLDKDGRVLNVFEAVDVIPCIKGGAYDELSSSLGDALSKRAEEFAGIYSCSEEDRLDSIFNTVRTSRVHRLIVIDDDSRLKGIISLSDILKYVLLHGEQEDVIRNPQGDL